MVNVQVHTISMLLERRKEIEEKVSSSFIFRLKSVKNILTLGNSQLRSEIWTNENGLRFIHTYLTVDVGLLKKGDWYGMGSLRNRDRSFCQKSKRRFVNYCDSWGE
jgi:hypothetical protein